MKITLLLAAMAAMAATQACAQTPGSVTISFPEGTEQLVVAPVPVTEYFSNSRMESLKDLTDTVSVAGKTSYTLTTDDEPLAVMVATTASASPRFFTAFAAPGETITLDLNTPNGDMTGSQLVEGITAWMAKSQALQTEFSALPPTASDAERQALLDQYNAEASALAMANADNALGVFMISQIQDEASMLKAYDALGQGAQTSILAPFYDAVGNIVNSRRAIIAAAENIKVGKPAPNFALPDPEGKIVTLSEYKGKWVMLDFWGSWCGWCIKGIPQMKEQWAELKDRNVVFLSIACQDSKETWLSALARYELPWVNVWSDPDTPRNEAVATEYAVSGFPTKLVIDPEGNIALIVVGEDPTFYDQLRALLPE